MYDYLKNFNAFYKCWLDTHYKIAYLKAPPDDSETSALDLESARKTHNAFYICLINILTHYAHNVDYILLVSEDRHLFAPLSDVAKRHHQAGTKLGYMLSGLNMVFECFSRMTLESQIVDKEKALIVENIRKIHAAYTVIAAEQWIDTDGAQYRKELDEKYAQLAHLEERFTNHIDMRRSSIAFIDSTGTIIQMNKAAKKLFGLDLSRQEYNIMDVLDYHFMSFESFVTNYGNRKHCPVRLMNGEKFLMSMVPLLHKDGVPYEHVIVLKDTRNTELRTNKEKTEYEDPQLKKLTYTEAQICTFVSNGTTSKQIAELMNISVETVKTHRKNIRKKLGLCESGVNMYAYIKNKGI